VSDTTALKERVSRDTVKLLAEHLAAFDPTFPRRRFVRTALKGLAELELKARIIHVADALANALPSPFPRAAALIQGANASAAETGSSLFAYWPLCTFVERYGTDHFDESFAVMHGLTRLASCEFAIRPLLDKEPERAFTILHRWVKDRDPHVRRLVSEGTRPRLPWGPRLKALQRDPSPSLPLLDRLYDDDELYVRRSVANHLNDISKDHPDLAVEIAGRWKGRGKGPTPGTSRGTSRGTKTAKLHSEWVIRHALRSLVKQGHTGALTLLGFGPAKLDLDAFELSTRRLRFGESMKLHLELHALADADLVIDYAVHHLKANGSLSPKVFKWATRQVKRGERLVLDKRHSIRPISTRRYYPGSHRCELLINGQSLAIEDFELFAVE